MSKSFKMMQIILQIFSSLWYYKIYKILVMDRHRKGKD